MLAPESFLAGNWIGPGPDAVEIVNPFTGDPQALAGSPLPDIAKAIAYAKSKGGAALREMGFHDRARMLKALASYLDGRKEELYALNELTGATRKDGWIDIDGGIATMFVFASKGRREMPDGHVYADGGIEQLSRSGSFLGQHFAVPLRGVALHINAYNFPVWGMLEKLAPALLAGVPVIVKPATVTSYLTEACVRMILESKLLPEGALQLIVGSVGDALDHMSAQDVVSFTGSAETALRLRSHPAILKNATRFIAEQDSLNASILGPDAGPGSAEYELFLSEAASEITVKCGQKCTAIRRLIVPSEYAAKFGEDLSARLLEKAPEMGVLVSPAQRRDVAEKTAMIASECNALLTPNSTGENTGQISPALFLAADPMSARHIHQTEAFGPVSTILPYKDVDEAATLANLGGGSLVTSLFTADSNVARAIALEIAPWNGRIYINSASSSAEATGHGSPLPHMIHGGPGRAGGGEELGGVRGVLHYMARVAVQGSPDVLSAISGQWVEGAKTSQGPAHPFQRTFNEIGIGETLWSESRTVTLEDIETFAQFTGDTFYAHMDEEAASANPFFPGRVAHGYLLLSFAAGLFVQPDPGPVLANTGLNDLSFQKPVSPGDELKVRLTARRKTRRTDSYGEIAWAVGLFNQNEEKVATYELLTMVSYDK